MKLIEIIVGLENFSNQAKARRIRFTAKEKARKANPGDSDTVTGWRSDPHQGPHFSTFLNRGGHG